MLIQSLFLDTLPGDGRSWLGASLASNEPEKCRSAFFAIHGRLTREAWSPTPESMDVLRQNRLEWLTTNTTLQEMARVLVLLRVVDASPESVGLVEDWYAQSSLLEKRAVLRALPLLPYPKRYAALATLGTLARDGVLFEAICYDNPYPSQYLDDAVFNSMVEASLVMGRPMDRILGLKDRMTPKIMCLFAEYGRPPSVK